MNPLIFLPGLACDERVWQAQLAALAALPAPWQTAVSDVHMREASVAGMAAALLADYPQGELVLCGASMGGIIAMEVARQCPERICGLALFGTNARPETPEIAALREAAILLFERDRVDEVLQANLPFAFHADALARKDLVETYLRVVTDAGADQLIRQNRALIGRGDARLHLARLSCPALVLVGDSDQLTPPECAREIAALLPGARLAEIARCGHMLTMERPTEVNAALCDWLANLPPRAA